MRAFAFKKLLFDSLLARAKQPALTSTSTLNCTTGFPQVSDAIQEGRTLEESC
jgi:hypothetical protein